MNPKLKELENLNKTLKMPRELSGSFLPKEQFDFLFVAEMPSIRKSKNRPKEECGDNFNVTPRDKFLQEMMIKYGVAGSYVTDIVKRRSIPRKPTKAEILKWTPFLLKEIDIIQPKAIIVLGQRTYKASFKPFVEARIPKEIKVDYVFHYSSQVPKKKFERRFSEVINRMRNS